MGEGQGPVSGRGKWLALMAALLGWMFDGLEQGLFPLVGRPALQELLGGSEEKQVALWFSVATAAFLVGMATGGVLFGWLGDRLGRVRAMTLSVLTYSIFSGLAGLCMTAPQIAACRFFSSVGMGGEWSLGVALVMEVWPDRSRSLMAGLIGASANVGYLLLALLGLFLAQVPDTVGNGLRSVGLPAEAVDFLVRQSAWRLLMMLGALPALLTFFFRLFVPESERWEKERGRGATSHWSASDLSGVLVGIIGAMGIIALWVSDVYMAVKIVGTVVALAVITVGYCFPLVRYLQRSANATTGDSAVWMPTVRRMLLGACLGGVPLVVTWSSVQWSSVWADKLTEDSLTRALTAEGASGGKLSEARKQELVEAKKVAKASTQLFGALGAILGCIGGALLGGWLGRRLTYSLLCLAAFGAAMLFFLGNDHYGPLFLFSQFLLGLFTASFYGWLPLYLPELFATRIRATAQGFSYNFGRNLAVVGALATGNLTAALQRYNHACAIMSLMYLVGFVLVWLAPETRGKPLPE
jgi:MFS family permease